MEVSYNSDLQGQKLGLRRAGDPRHPLCFRRGYSAAGRAARAAGQNPALRCPSGAFSLRRFFLKLHHIRLVPKKNHDIRP